MSTGYEDDPAWPRAARLWLELYRTVAPALRQSLSTKELLAIDERAMVLILDAIAPTERS
jgi:hypothetical protein